MSDARDEREALYEGLRRRTGSARVPEEFFCGLEPEKLPPISGPAAKAWPGPRPKPDVDKFIHDSLDGVVKQGSMIRGCVLREALVTINGERQDVYGSPEDSFALIADYWTLYLQSTRLRAAGNGFAIGASDVAMMMTLFKVAREANQHKRDNLVDAAGYLGIYADMQGVK